MKNTNNNTDIQLTGSTDVRNGKKVSHIRMALAGTGVTSALLLGSLFGATGLAHAAPTHTTKSSTASTQMTTLSARSEQMTTAPMSYTMNADYVGVARQAASAAGISPDLFVRQIQQESGFNPGASSPAGAVGIAQFMPATAAAMGVNPYDPTSALYGGARLMGQLSGQFGGNYGMALAAYNGGPGAVQNAISAGGGNWMGFLPTESRNYVNIIMG
ncbi:MAG: lytic transglycosylase domain-containing protein [Ktedonobacteraceae bacterium]